MADHYQANKALYDRQTPNASDPERLSQAEQATDFLNHRGKNPFRSLSLEQLTLIMYDESDSFTYNERRSAWRELDDRDTLWRLAIVAKLSAERHATGKETSTLSEILTHYQNLPAIEQAQLDRGWEARLKFQIRQDFNFDTQRAEGMGKIVHNRLGKIVVEG